MTQINDKYLKHVEVNNPELLKILNEYAELHKLEGFEEHCHLTAEEHVLQRPYWMSDEYREEVLAQGNAHEGFPDMLVAYNFKLSERAHTFFERDADPVFKRDLTHKLGDLNARMMDFLSTKHNALAAVYPPGGFIAWHNNQNAPGYNLIFTWSETGDGHFSYVHPETKEIVKCQDEAGKWTCKAAYFGSFDEEDKKLMHAAETDCWRVTVSYVFDWTEGSDDLREMVLEDISATE
jgi:hypothetical protein